MNWEAIGAIGEAVGAAAVVASLLYLAVQLRGSTRASTVQAKLESTRLMTDFLDSLIQSPELNDLFLRGREDIESLSSEEYYRYSNMSLKAFSYFSAGYFQFRNRTLAEDDWFELRAVLRFWLGGRGCCDWWQKVGCRMYGPDFIKFIESEIARVDAV